MPFPLSSIALVSMEVTRALIVLGYGLNFDTDAAAAGRPRFTSLPSYAPLAITACTGNGVSPVVITTAYPHGVSGRDSACGGLSCVVSGVLGNNAANNIDTDPSSRTCGQVNGVLARPLSPTTLALYGQDHEQRSTTYGALIPIVGTGAYTGGGTVVPALTDGSILIGRANVIESSAPPRIVFIPKGITPKQGKPSSPNYDARNSERRVLIQQRAIAIDTHLFEVHAWGKATPPDPAMDYVATMVLRDCVQSAMYDLLSIAADTIGATWNDEKERATQFVKSGHLLSFGVTMAVPVTDNPILGGLPFVPNGLTLETTVQSPTPEIGATFLGPVITPS